jgi:hypothetical protein
MLFMHGGNTEMDIQHIQSVSFFPTVSVCMCVCVCVCILLLMFLLLLLLFEYLSGLS